MSGAAKTHEARLFRFKSPLRGRKLLGLGLGRRIRKFKKKPKNGKNRNPSSDSGVKLEVQGLIQKNSLLILNFLWEAAYEFMRFVRTIQVQVSRDFACSASWAPKLLCATPKSQRILV